MATRGGYPQAILGVVLDVARIRNSLESYVESLKHRSAGIVGWLELHMSAVLVAWIALLAIACLPRLLLPATPIESAFDALGLVAPYLLLAAAPVAGFALASSSFPRGILTAQPGIRFSVYGRWRRLGVVEARRDPSFGPAGFMASMLIGLLLNVVVRTIEFLVAMPAMGGSAPLWGDRLFALMAADVILMSFFYMVCFVMALRTIPFFPRMLLFAWMLDIAMQMLIARSIAVTPGVPLSVTEPLHELLQGNITKVLISAAVWLPYLILSDRVNITYRLRTRLNPAG